MPDIKSIGSSRDVLAQLMDMRRGLRREMITFLLSLSDVWKKFPPELSSQSKTNLLKESIKIFFEELDYSSALLDQQNNAVMQALTLENAILKENLHSLDELAVQVTKFEKQQKQLHDILEDLDVSSPFPDAEAALTSGHGDSDIAKLKQHIFFLQKSSRQLSDLVDRLAAMVNRSRGRGLFHNDLDIKLKELVNAVETVTRRTI